MWSSYTLTVLAASLLCVEASAQQLISTLSGTTGQGFGTAAVDAGDQNGDGYRDVLVSAPYGSSVVYCISGAYLKTGTGTKVLWSFQPSIAPSNFGVALANVGDVTGDGIVDFAVGAPFTNYGPAGSGVGAVYLISGATHTVHSIVYGSSGQYATDAYRFFGSSLATVGDVDGDGKAELAVGMPGNNVNSGGVYVITGAGLAAGGFALQLSIGGASSGATFGTSLASGVDFNGDGKNDVVVGSPSMPAFGTGIGQGYVDIISAVGFNTFLGHYKSTFDGDDLGLSVSVRTDYDGDGKPDIVAGAPYWIGADGSYCGRALVLSGAKMITNTVPKELYTLDGSFLNNSPGHVAQMHGHFGSAVCATADLNNDGVGDYLVGASYYYSVVPSSPIRGAVEIFSGATGLRIGEMIGDDNEFLGDALMGALQDLDGDGFKEFLVAGPYSNNPVNLCGTLKCYRLFPWSPSVYCTGKLNSLFCMPSISSSGLPSATSAAPFSITASNIINHQAGLMIYSNRPAATPFQDGTLCVKPPTKRTPLQFSGGSPNGTDCTGTFSFDFNARIQSGIDPALATGAEVFCQYWSRDSHSSSTTSLTDALRLLINP